MTETTFERRFARDLGRYAEGGVRPIDASEIAVATIASGGPRSIRDRLVSQWFGRVRLTPRLLVVALLALLAIAVAVTAVGLQLQRPPIVTDRPQPSAQAVVPSPSVAVEAAVAPRIAFVQDGNVFVAGTDGSDPVKVLDDPGIAFTNVHWLTDGRHVVVEGADLASVLDLTTGEHRRLDLPRGTTIAWRPGADEVAGLRSAPFGQPSVIVLADALTGATREIPAEPGLGALAWSSDGTSLGALSGRDFVRIDPATGRQVLVATAVADLAPDQVVWASDLQRVAYVITPESPCEMVTKTCEAGQASIYVADATASDPAAVSVMVAGPLPQERLEPDNTHTVFGPPPTPGWSPDGAWLAYRTADGLSIVRPDGTGRRDVVAMPVETFRWQADGTGLLFTAASGADSGDGELFAVDIDGGAPRSLGLQGVSQVAGQAMAPADIAPPPVGVGPASSAAPTSEPAASPRVTLSLPEGPFRLFVGVDPPGSCRDRMLEVDVEMRTTHAIGPCGASLTPDGRHLVHGDTVEDLVDGTVATFPGRAGWSPQGRWVTIGPDYSAPSGSTWTIATWDAARQITVPQPYVIPGYGPTSPAWSPDERYIAIRTDPTGVVMVDLSTGTQQAIEDIPSIWTWSRGGDRIGIVRDGDAWIADADGTDIRNLSEFAFGGAGGIWLSPDGGTAAVTQERSLWLIDVDGARRKVDTRALFGDQPFDVTWSPDGERLALVAGVPDEGRGHGRTVMIDRDGRTLANVEAAHAVWSPTGEVLAAVVDPQDLDQNHTTAPITPHHKGTTYLIARDGATQTLSTAWGPAWSPDGRAVAIVTGGTGAAGWVEIVRADGTGRHRVSATVRWPGGLVWMRPTH